VVLDEFANFDMRKESFELIKLVHRECFGWIVWGIGFAMLDAPCHLIRERRQVVYKAKLKLPLHSMFPIFSQFLRIHSH
jgi:hypothetical protein